MYMLKSRWYGYKDLYFFFRRMYRVLTFISPFHFLHLRTFKIYPKNNTFSFKSNPIALMTELAFIHKYSKAWKTKCFCRNSNFYKVQILVMHFGNEKINKWFNTYNFKIKDAPNGNVISSHFEKYEYLQY